MPCPRFVKMGLINRLRSYSYELFEQAMGKKFIFDQAEALFACAQDTKSIRFGKKDYLLMSTKAEEDIHVLKIANAIKTRMEAGLNLLG